MSLHPYRSFLAETIAIGSELLIGGRSDSNSLFIAELLGSLGIEVRFKSIVGDDRDDIVQVLRTAVRRAGVVVMTGGLGPTVDDCTREAVAALTGLRLARRKEALDQVTNRLAQWGRVPSPAQLRQARVPAGAEVLPNPVGSAPGFALYWKGTWLIALPGVPTEMQAMMRESVVPLLMARLVRSVHRSPPPILRVAFHTWGLPEAEVDARLRGLLPPRSAVALGLLASPMGVVVSLTAKRGAVSQPPLLHALQEEVRRRLGDWIFAEGNDSMEAVVGRLLLKHRLTVALAESCTGGLITHRLTHIPGSSAYVERGVVCYSNQAKVDLLGVPEDLIATHGAVSREVAVAMAKGIRQRAAVAIGLSVTGIAGPGGATDTKPVGLVYVALDGGEAEVVTKEFRFHGDRVAIQQRSSQAALDLLRRWLMGKGG